MWWLVHPVVWPRGVFWRTRCGLAPVRQQRLQPGPLLIGQIVTIEHAPVLPHPAVLIHGTRSNRETLALLDAGDRPGALDRYRLIYAQVRAEPQTMTFDAS